MENHNIIDSLIKIANILDEKNMMNEADEITKIAQDISSPSFNYVSDSTGLESPDEYRSDDLFLQSDKFEEEKKFAEELARAEAMDRINELAQKSGELNKEELMEYARLMNVLSGESSESETENFKNILQESGINLMQDDKEDPFV